MEALKEKASVTYKSRPIRRTVSFSIKALKTRAWSNVLQVMKNKDVKPRLAYSVNYNWKNKKKHSVGENSLQKLMTTKLVLRRILEVIFWTEKDDQTQEALGKE